MQYKRERPKRGVLVCINNVGDGKLQLTLDDIKRETVDGSKWLLDVFITSKEYDENQFKDLKFDEKELADFGYYILARLHAFFEQKEL